MKKNKSGQLLEALQEVPEPGWVSAGVTAHIEPNVVTDPSVLRAGQNFTEALGQGQALAAPGSREAEQIARMLQQTTARKNGLQLETAMKQAVTPPDVFKMLEGPHPTGKAAEVVVSRAYKDMHAHKLGEVVNPPTSISSNVVDVRLSPDSASRRDLLFQIQLPDGKLLIRPGGQVKTGSGQYLANSLSEMAQSAGYGRTAYVDARFVNPDGSPRVATDGFTEPQARKLREAGVRLRGIHELERQSQDLVEDLRQFRKDGLEPEARARLQKLRDNIASAYRPGGIASRALGGAAIAAAASAVMSLAVQLLSDGKVDVVTVAKSAGEASLIAGASTLADAGLYHLASWLGATPEAAQAMAAQGMAAGFFVIAAGMDAASEVRAALSGQTTTADAVMGTSVKVALDALPLMLMPLGMLGLPIALAGQVGGRWVIQRVRQSDALIRQALSDNLSMAQHLTAQVEATQPTVQRLRSMSDEVDEFHARLMQGRKPILRVIR